MNSKNVLTKVEIIVWLKTIQLSSKYGEKSIPLSDIAKKSQIHRDTLYEAINGRMSETTQKRLSLVIERLEAEFEGKTRTKLAHVAISNNQVKLGFGISNTPILRKI